MILAGDIGGTKVALGLFRATAGGRLELVWRARYPSRRYDGLVPIVREFLAAPEAARDPSEPIEIGVFGVAGPVIDDEVDATNLPWVLAEGEVAEALGAPRVELVNDLVATAEGIGLLGPEAFFPLQAGRADARGNGAVIAAGTGLGACLLLRARDGALAPLPSEGGHASFAPQSADEDELLRYLRRVHGGHVSAERVVSGAGLPQIYAWLVERGIARESDDVRRRLAREDPARVISEEALASRCGLCVRALEVFVSAYGSAAGDLALTGLATAGVWVAGGIAPKILPKLSDGTFVAAFCDKGRMRPLLEQIPIRVVLDSEAALLGAARFAARKLREGG